MSQKAADAGGGGPSDKVLSSNLLNMRFMRRREESELREKERRLLEARWVIKSHDETNVILILSEERFDLSPPVGRRSFKGFNAALESLVEQQLREHKQTSIRHQKRKEISAEPVAALVQESVVSDDGMASFALAAKRKR